MAYIYRYITQGEYEVNYMQFHKFYEGFVIGYGYVYPTWISINTHTLSDCHSDSEYLPQPSDDNYFKSVLRHGADRSRDAVKLSLRGLFKNGEAFVIVSHKDTLSQIASLFDVTVDELVLWNDIEDADYIRVGQKILIKGHNPTAVHGASENIISGDKIIGGLVSAVGGLKYTDNIPFLKAGGFWRGVNGRRYFAPEAVKGGGRGWNLKANSLNIAKGAKWFKYARYIGNVGGVVSVAASTVSFIDEPNLKDGADILFGVVGLVYWPVGAVYVGGNLLYKGVEKLSESWVEGESRRTDLTDMPWF